MKLLFLSEKEVKSLLTTKEALTVVEGAFREKGLEKVQMPAKSYVFFKKYNGDFRVMPAYLEKMDAAGVKVVNVHPDNISKYGLPAIMAVIVLIDPKSGAPISIMDGTWLTSVRTGAAGGVAVKYLARKGSKVIGIVGAGVQARFQLMAIKETLAKIDEVRVTSRRRESMEKCAKDMREALGLNARAVESIEETVRGADVVVTVTPVRSPIVMNDWIGLGTHINAIGADAPGKEELDPMILKRAKIVVDDWEQALHSGEVNVPLSTGIISKEDIYGELGKIVSGEIAGRTSPEEITIFDSTGLAVQDVSTAWTVYERAKERGVGQYLELF